MIVIPPITITEAMVSSTIPEPDASVGEVLWNAATNYIAGNTVVRTTTHKVYERVGTSGVDAGLPEVTPSKWVEVGPTNRWAMFDISRSTGSSLPSGVTTITITPGTRVNSLGVIGCTALVAETSVQVGAETTYSSTDNLFYRFTNSWYSYFLGKFSYKANFTKVNIPPSISSVITFTFHMGGTGGRVGGIIIGNKVNVGDIQVNPIVEAINFSKVERDSYGNSILIPRRSVPKTTQKTFVSKTNINKLMQTRAELNAKPALWVGLEDELDGYYDALLIFGIYTEFSINMEYPEHATISLELEEI